MTGGELLLAPPERADQQPVFQLLSLAKTEATADEDRKDDLPSPAVHHMQAVACRDNLQKPVAPRRQSSWPFGHFVQ